MSTQQISPEVQAALDAVPLLPFVSYSSLALRTCKPLPEKHQLTHAELGLNTEMGEAGDIFKRWAIYGTPFDNVHVMEEVADALWYINLWIVTKGLPPSLGDEAWHQVKTGKVSSAFGLKDPFEFASAFNVAVFAAATLCIPEAQREVSDKQTVLNVLLTLCCILQTTGFTLEEACQRNIRKLVLRYGDKFSEYAATHRNTAAERVVLEG